MPRSQVSRVGGNTEGKNVKGNMDNGVRVVRGWEEGVGLASRSRYDFVGTWHDLVSSIKEGRTNGPCGGNERVVLVVHEASAGQIRGGFRLVFCT